MGVCGARKAKQSIARRDREKGPRKDEKSHEARKQMERGGRWGRGHRRRKGKKRTGRLIINPPCSPCSHGNRQ